MNYEKTIVMKDGSPCLIRSAGKEDAQEVLDVFIRCHAETDNLTSYPDEKAFTTEMEADFLDNKEKNEREAELCAVVDGKIVGTAGIDAIGSREKLRHRCCFGISILRASWGKGIGKALTAACIECAKRAGYEQMELEVVTGNTRAEEMYKSLGFIEYGRNPIGFKGRSGYQELVLMRLDLSS